MRTVSALMAICGLAAVATADVRLNELLLNPPGSDNGQEFFELSGTPGQSLNGMWLVVIEGDGTAGGVVDKVIDLNGFSLGSNGLFLWRDAISVIDTSLDAGVQGPDAGTTINVADFDPDIENGSNTYLLVSGFSGAITNDLDTNNDGVLDLTPWASVVDGIGFLENDTDNRAYAAQLGFTDFGPNAAYNADILIRGTDNVWYGSDVLGTNPGGPYTLDPTRNSTGLANAADFCATPGVANVIPAPSVLALAGMGALAAGRRRR